MDLTSAQTAPNTACVKKKSSRAATFSVVRTRCVKNEIACDNVIASKATLEMDRVVSDGKTVTMYSLLVPLMESTP